MLYLPVHRYMASHAMIRIIKIGHSLVCTKWCAVTVLWTLTAEIILLTLILTEDVGVLVIILLPWTNTIHIITVKSELIHQNSKFSMKITTKHSKFKKKSEFHCTQSFILKNNPTFSHVHGALQSNKLKHCSTVRNRLWTKNKTKYFKIKVCVAAKTSKYYWNYK